MSDRDDILQALTHLLPPPAEGDKSPYDIVSRVEALVREHREATLIQRARAAYEDPHLHTRFSPSRQRWEVLLGREPFDPENPLKGWAQNDPRSRTVGFGETESEALQAAINNRHPGLPTDAHT